ncbi:DUF2461 family protein, partial [Carbonactinospora thermoautotrophica]|uniref:DUF2461 family protein n=1 Tax=Carbonactinospora thermoautotrophica TaxID=1469144 RepID=UPI000A722932
MGHFVGFSPKAFEFFEGLLADNSKEYWAKHRDTYKEYVKEPVKALVEALQPDFGESVRVMSLQRDTRFAPDKPRTRRHRSRWSTGTTARATTWSCPRTA